MAGKDNVAPEEGTEDLKNEVEQEATLNESPLTDEDTESESQEEEEIDEVAAELEKLKAEIAEAKDKHLRLYSEFENYRRRTSKERLELIKTASEDLMVNLIPILDDFERAHASFTDDVNIEAVKEGFELIFAKFSKTLDQKGVKPMDIGVGSEFDAELHEAITQIPAPKNKLKGKIVDVIEKGYTFNDKVIRFAKVVIGS